MSLVINALGGGYIDTHTNMQTKKLGVHWPMTSMCLV